MNLLKSFHFYSFLFDALVNKIGFLEIKHALWMKKICIFHSLSFQTSFLRPKMLCTAKILGLNDMVDMTYPSECETHPDGLQTKSCWFLTWLGQVLSLTKCGWNYLWPFSDLLESLSERQAGRGVFVFIFHWLIDVKCWSFFDRRKSTRWRYF